MDAQAAPPRPVEELAVDEPPLQVPEADVKEVTDAVPVLLEEVLRLQGDLFKTQKIRLIGS